MGMFYGYKTNGIIQNSEQASEYSSSVGKLEPGEVRYVDISGSEGRPDGKVDSYDRTIIGNPHPDFEINFSNRFSWRNLEFSFNIAGVYGNDILNGQSVPDRVGNLLPRGIRTHEGYVDDLQSVEHAAQDRRYAQSDHERPVCGGRLLHQTPERDDRL